MLYLLSHFADKVAWICLILLQLLFWGGAAVMIKMYSNTHDAISGNFNSERVFGGSEWAM
jgi:hypothetical protein